MFIIRVNHEPLAKLREPYHSRTMRLPKVVASFGNDWWNPSISQIQYLHDYLSNTSNNTLFTSFRLVLRVIY
jgi:hypothetical protein